MIIGYLDPHALCMDRFRASRRPSVVMNDVQVPKPRPLYEQIATTAQLLLKVKSSTTAHGRRVALPWTIEILAEELLGPCCHWRLPQTSAPATLSITCTFKLKCFQQFRVTASSGMQQFTRTWARVLHPQTSPTSRSLNSKSSTLNPKPYTLNARP